MKRFLFLTMFFIGTVAAEEYTINPDGHLTQPPGTVKNVPADSKDSPRVVIPNAVTLNDSILVDRPIGAEVLNRKFKQGPLHNKGQVIIETAKKHGIDPLFLAAYFSFETNWGSSRQLKQSNNPAKIPELDSSGLKKLKENGSVKLREFASIEDGINAGAEYLKAIAVNNPVPANPSSVLSVTNHIFPEKDAGRIKREIHQKSVLAVMNMLARLEAHK